MLELCAGVSFAPLASAESFVNALYRDVHILAETYALTWTWLDDCESHKRGEQHLQVQYGAFAVFERVWCTTGWSRIEPALGPDATTRRAFYGALCDAFLGAFARAAPLTHRQDLRCARRPARRRTSRITTRCGVAVCTILALVVPDAHRAGRHASDGRHRR